MTGLFRWTILTALLIAVGTALPARAVAGVPCTDGYQGCLNDSFDKKGFAEILANLECGARYARCIIDFITG
jgi:hypothetical protein